MSDSYTAWCDLQDRNSRMFSDENVKSAKKTKEFQTLLKKANTAYNSFKLCEAKSCANCMHRTWINNKEICEKIGAELYATDLVCNKWSGAPYTPSKIKPNCNIIAWLVINKNKSEYYGY